MGRPPPMIASNLFIWECSRVSKPIPDSRYASIGSFQVSSWERSSRQLFLTFIAASQVADAALLPLGTEGEMLEECDPEVREGMLEQE